MEEDMGVVQSGGGPRPAARSNHNRADHVGARETLLRHIPNGIEYPQIRTALPN